MALSNALLNRETTDDEPGMTVTVQLFGQFSVQTQGRLLARMRSRKEQWLLALLVLRATAKPLDRSWLAGTLWPESRESTALFYLRRSLMLLRDALGPEARRILSPSPRTLQFDLVDAYCDVLEFYVALQRGDAMSLQRAVDLYRGPLLEGCAEEWILTERERCSSEVLRALQELNSLALDADDHAASAAYMRQVLELDPLSETALRGLMSALAAKGNQAEAVELYRTFRTQLRQAANSEPEPQTVQVYQSLRVEGGANTERSAELASANSRTDSYPSGLPSALSHLIGRRAERDAVIECLEEYRLVTLTGTGGAGKTRLSLSVAEAVKADFSSGVWFVDLSPLRGSEQLVPTILATLGVSEVKDELSEARLEAFLQPKRLLLILDNCEHLLADCASLAQALLWTCPYLRILTTSRESLRASGEAVFPVHGLVLAEARDLFAARASQASFSFQMNAANTAAVSEICDRLEGIPLAIEMAAARTRAMSVPQIAKNLSNVFRLLNLPGGNLEPRHQTLRATLKWSYDLLTEAERVLLVRLSIFAGGWTIEAAESVCAGGEALEADAVLEALLGLVDKSLVVYAETESDQGRYSLLETTRQYAAEMIPSEERAVLADRHADYFALKALELRRLAGVPGEHETHRRLFFELANFRTALRWAQSTGSVQPSLRISGCLGVIWVYYGLVAEGRRHLKAALALEAEADAFVEDRCAALKCSGILACGNQDFDESLLHYHLALPLARSVGDSWLTGTIHFNIAVTQGCRKEYDIGRQHIQLAMDLWSGPALRNRIGRAKCLRVLSDLAQFEGDQNAAETLIEQSTQMFEEADDLGCVMSNCIVIGVLARDLSHREPLRREALLLRALEYGRRALNLARGFDDMRGTLQAIAFVASVMALQGRFGMSARLDGFDEATRKTFDTSALDAGDLAALAISIASGRAALGDAAFDDAWAAGGALTKEQAIDLALSD